MSSQDKDKLLESLRSVRAARAARNGHSQVRSGHSASDKDAVVQGTDDDAAGSRLSAVSLGYLQDEFAQHFATEARRMPIINRGTYVRTRAVDTLVNRFLRSYQAEQVQIISLGAGTDTRPFRLLSFSQTDGHHLCYVEIDFPKTTSSKINVIERTEAIMEVIKSARGQWTISMDKSCLTSQAYCVHAADLRGLAGDIPAAEPPAIAGLDPEKPTLILSEMCLTYVEAATSTSILRDLLRHYLSAAPSVEIVLYEPLQPNDAFGRTMIANLSSRHIELPGMIAFPTLEAHRERLREAGFTEESKSWTIRQVWEQWISQDEKDRLRTLEMVDEEEEWHLLAEHYGVIWARRGPAAGS